MVWANEDPSSIAVRTYLQSDISFSQSHSDGGSCFSPSSVTGCEGTGNVKATLIMACDMGMVWIHHLSWRSQNRGPTLLQTQTTSCTVILGRLWIERHR